MSAYLTSLSTTSNILEGTATAGVPNKGFTFGRTVIVTAAYVKRSTTIATFDLMLGHRTTVGAAATNFGTATITTTLSIYHPLAWQPLTVAEKTFTSNEVLSLNYTPGTDTLMGNLDLIVRYKEK